MTRTVKSILFRSPMMTFVAGRGHPLEDFGSRRVWGGYRVTDVIQSNTRSDSPKRFSCRSATLKSIRRIGSARASSSSLSFCCSDRSWVSFFRGKAGSMTWQTFHIGVRWIPTCHLRHSMDRLFLFFDSLQQCVEFTIPNGSNSSICP